MAFCLGAMLTPAFGGVANYTKGSDGSNAHQYRNPCKVSVKADPGLVVWKTLYLEPRAYSFPVTAAAAAGWKIVSAKYRNTAGQEVVLQPPANPAVNYWPFSIPKAVTLTGDTRIVTVRFATLRQTPGGTPDYQEDIVIAASVAANLATLDIDGDGMPEAWEQQYFGTFYRDGTADADADGISDKAEYLRGTSPIDFWNGKPPVLTIISGDGQGDLAGRTLIQPLKVRITNQEGRAKPGLPVAFSVVSPSTGGARLTPAVANTDTAGFAQLIFKLPSSAPGTPVIVEAAISGASVQFTASIGDPGLPPSAPSNGEFSMQDGDTAVLITWTDNSNNETAFYVDRTEDNVTWTRVATLLPNTTSYVDRGLRPGRCYIYTVIVHN